MHATPSVSSAARQLSRQPVRSTVKDEAPTVAVVVPTYNGARFLPHALHSLIGQGPELAEVIVVDDGSTDGTLDIVRTFSAQLPIRWLEQRHAGNWVASTNRGIAASTSAFITFLHQDDLWFPGRLKAFTTALDRAPDLGVFVNRSRFINDCGRTVGPWSCRLPAERLLSPQVVFPRLFVQNFIAVPSPIVRRSLLRELDPEAPLDESLWYLADWKLWLSLAERTPWYYADTPFTGFRIHPHSITASSPVSNDYRAQFEHILRHFEPSLQRLAPARASRYRAVAEFSVAMNLALAEAYFRGRPRWRSLGALALRLGPRGWLDYLRYSRIVERVISRLRVLTYRRESPRSGTLPV